MLPVNDEYPRGHVTFDSYHSAVKRVDSHVESLLQHSGILARKQMPVIGHVTGSVHRIISTPRRMKHG